jgi:uncharacterized repeat protein (TIGR02543 family)
MLGMAVASAIALTGCDDVLSQQLLDKLRPQQKSSFVLLLEGAAYGASYTAAVVNEAGGKIAAVVGKEAEDGVIFTFTVKAGEYDVQITEKVGDARTVKSVSVIFAETGGNFAISWAGMLVISEPAAAGTTDEAVTDVSDEEEAMADDSEETAEEAVAKTDEEEIADELAVVEETDTEEETVDEPAVEDTGSDEEAADETDFSSGYVISFNVNGGSPAITAQTAMHGEVASEPAANSVSKANLRFKHWYANGQTTVPFDFAAPVTADTQVNALWEADVTFNLNGATGTPPATQVVAEGGLATEPPTPVWTGYTFEGWYTEATGATKWEFGTNTVLGHTQLYAKLTSTFKVEFNSNDGSAVPPIDNIPDGETITEPPAPTKANLRFRGWYKNLTDTAKFDFNTPITENLTLNAVWEADVSFDLNGAEGTAPATQVVIEGGKATTPVIDVSRGTDWMFTGWWTEASGGSRWRFDTNTVHTHLTLYARWTRLWTVTLYRWVDTAYNMTTNYTTTRAPDGGTYTPAAPVMAFYTFGGWCTDAAMTNVVTSITVTADTTLYAKWLPTSETRVRVSFNLNGGFWDEVLDKDVPKSYLPLHGTNFNVSVRNMPRRVGYSFQGWFYDSALTQAVPVVKQNILISNYVIAANGNAANGNMTLYAKWQQEGNLRVQLHSGVLKSNNAVKMVYEYASVPYGARLIDVPLGDYTYTFCVEAGKVTGHKDMAAQNGSRVALRFPYVNENRLKYYEYWDTDIRFYWGDRIYSDMVLWGKYKWDASISNKNKPMPGWDQDYP